MVPLGANGKLGLHEPALVVMVRNGNAEKEDELNGVESAQELRRADLGGKGLDGLQLETAEAGLASSELGEEMTPSLLVVGGC